MCTLEDSYFHSFSMVFTNDWSFLDKATGAHSVLMIIFAFFIGILLLNIIIAVISDGFTEVKQNGQRAFWLKRLRFISELQSLNVVLQRFLPIKLGVNLGDEEDDGNAQAAPLISKGEVEGYSSIVKEEDESSKDDADELDNTSANDNKSFSINLERISLTRGKSIGNWSQSQNFKDRDFIYWYKAGASEFWTAPRFLWRLVAFLKIAKWDEETNGWDRRIGNGVIDSVKNKQKRQGINLRRIRCRCPY